MFWPRGCCWPLSGGRCCSLGLRERFGPVAAPVAFAAALLWTVHPLNTQAVTYIVQRTESLASLFYLLTLYCTLRGATNRDGETTPPNPVRALVVCRGGGGLLFRRGDKGSDRHPPIVVLLYDRVLSGSFRAAVARRGGLYIGLLASWG